MLKRKVVIVISFMFLMMSMMGCGSKGTSSNVENNKDSKKDVTLTYGIWDKNQEPGMRAMADRFEELNPGIKVNVEVTPWDEYWMKLEAAATGGALPDVFWMHTNQFLRYAQSDMLLEVGTMVEKDPELSYDNYPEGLVKMYEYNGKNYAIPKDFDTIGLIYNRKIFDDAKVPYPDDTWDWDKLVEVAKQLTDESKGIWGFAAENSSQSGFYNIIYQNQGSVIKEDLLESGYDMPETIEAIQFWTDLILKHKVSPTLAQMTDTTPIALFTSGKVAMMFMGSWMITELTTNENTKEVADIAILPKGKTRATIYNGLGNSISAKTKYPEEAKKFLKFLGSKEANLIQAEHGSAIPAFEGTQAPWIQYNTKYNLWAFVEMLDYGIPFPSSETKNKWERNEETYRLKMFSGEISVEEGCKALAEEMNEHLATEKK